MAGKPTFISVNRQAIAKNNKLTNPDEMEPPIRVAKGSKKVLTKQVDFTDGSGNVLGRVRYDPHHAINGAGAKVVIEWYGDYETYP